METEFKTGLKIKKLRELRNYTQEFMAEKLSMSQTGYSNIERDETDVSLSRLQQIAKVLEIKLQDLLGFDEKMLFVGTMTNNNTNQAGVIFSSETFERERKLYEEQIKQLKEEVAFLRGLVGERAGF
ncbi:MAG: XRE family transcriptional regulator [Cytophagales bacterium]|nr:MAG: XRE family transcriptional regulator [Cytophagales bacterium]